MAKPAPYYNLARYYWAAGDLEGMVEAYKNVLRADPQNVAAANNLAVTYMQLKRIDPAIDMLVQCVQGAPDWPDPWRNLVTCYDLKGDWDNYHKAAVQWLRVDPKNPIARLAVTIAEFRQQSDFVRAEAACQTILSKHGDVPQVLRFLSSLAQMQGKSESVVQYEKRAKLAEKQKPALLHEIHGADIQISQ